MADTHQVDGNQLTLLQNGGAYFPQLCADVDAAQRFVYLESYIFLADKAGILVSQALQRAARRGVVVCVLLDGFGSAELPLAFVAELREAGVQLQWFRRELYRFKLRRHRLRRLHRKLVAIDGEVAFIGGINVIDDYAGNDGSAAPRFDFAVRVQGGVAGEIHFAMRRLWSAVSWARQRVSSSRVSRSYVQSKNSKLLNINILFRDNLLHRRDIERAYLTAINAAQREVIIANAYFLPGRIFRRALIQAAQRGVRVVLLLQGRVEHRLLFLATHALYPPLLAAGIEIYEYQASYLHAKVAVVDEQWATVGSSNIDPFSLLLAREANLVVTDAGFAGALREQLLEAMAQDALRIEVLHWHRSGWLMRLSARVSYAVIRMLIGVLGYGKRVV